MKLFKFAAVFMLILGCVSATTAQDAPSREIVYSQEGKIKVVDTLSGTVTQLTFLDNYASNPVWSPDDGSFIAFIAALSSDYYGSYGLFVMNADGSDMRQLADDLMWRSDIIWTDDGSALIYATSAEPDGGDCILNIVNLESGQVDELFRQPHPECSVPNLNPALSPDGTRLAFGLDEDGDGNYYQLYTLTLADRQLTRLTDNRANNAAPEWSPDGTQIAYVSDQDKQDEIYVMNADGSSPRRVTRRPADDYAPHWRLNGQQIIFASEQDGYNLYEVDVSTGVVRNLTNLTDSGAWSAALSPDGTQMAYLVGSDPVAGPDGVQLMILNSGATFDLPDIGLGAFAFMWRPV